MKDRDHGVPRLNSGVEVDQPHISLDLRDYQVDQLHHLPLHHPMTFLISMVNHKSLLKLLRTHSLHLPYLPRQKGINGDLYPYHPLLDLNQRSNLPHGELRHLSHRPLGALIRMSSPEVVQCWLENQVRRGRLYLV